jgi:hypothetical protein
MGSWGRLQVLLVQSLPGYFARPDPLTTYTTGRQTAPQLAGNWSARLAGQTGRRVRRSMGMGVHQFSFSDLFHRPAGFAGAETVRRRGLLEESRLHMELKVTSAFDVVRAALSRKLLLDAPTQVQSSGTLLQSSSGGTEGESAAGSRSALALDQTVHQQQQRQRQRQRGEQEQAGGSEKDGGHEEVTCEDLILAVRPSMHASRSAHSCRSFKAAPRPASAYAYVPPPSDPWPRELHPTPPLLPGWLSAGASHSVHRGRLHPLPVSHAPQRCVLPWKGRGRWEAPC